MFSPKAGSSLRDGLPNKSVCALPAVSETKFDAVPESCLRSACKTVDQIPGTVRGEGSIACSSRRGRRSQAGTSKQWRAFLGRHDWATADSTWESSGSRSSTARAGLVSEYFPFNKGCSKLQICVVSSFPKKCI